MKQLPKHKSLEPYVKDILLIENSEDDVESNLPFYAEGYPGIVYAESKHDFYLYPKTKKLSDFYLFGQTIQPMSLKTIGPFRIIAFRLYPFAMRVLLGIDPKTLNDDCYDLLELPNIDTKGVVQKLNKTEAIEDKLAIISEYINDLHKQASANPDNSIKLALNLIINTKGNISIKEVYEQLFITERTFERRFNKEVGVTPKQFASIIQFSSSMNKLSENEFTILTDIGLESGYADQSHFIRTFKKYTGKTPSGFLKSIKP